ncbi:hypothetical protein S40293_10912 [Stachybotrys chartarum IBT 40293]|nr:hypothetical protein S40293_10912 [Stachybotrys chartarum IBT 40293]
MPPSNTDHSLAEERLVHIRVQLPAPSSQLPQVAKGATRSGIPSSVYRYAGSAIPCKGGPRRERAAYSEPTDSRCHRRTGIGGWDGENELDYLLLAYFPVSAIARYVGRLLRRCHCESRDVGDRAIMRQELSHISQRIPEARFRSLLTICECGNRIGGSEIGQSKAIITLGF